MGGWGVVSDFGHPRTRGEGGQKRANFCGRPLWMAPNHFNLSPMFLTCLLSGLTVIDIMSIVHMDIIWVEIAKTS